MSFKVSVTAVVLGVMGFPFSASAQSVDSMDAAINLGSVLAAEIRCGLSYNQAAISQWIDDNTNPNDMGFASNLAMMTDGAAFQIQSMTQSSITAHCRSIERTARYYGFIE